MSNFYNLQVFKNLWMPYYINEAIAIGRAFCFICNKKEFKT